MGACSSSTENWGWVVTQSRCLNGPTISTQAPTQDTKLATRGYRINLLVASPMPSQGQPDSEKYFIVLESRQTHSLIAKVHRLQYVNFVPQTKNATNEGMNGYVRNFNARCRGTWSTSEWSQLCTWAQRTYFWFNLGWWASKTTVKIGGWALVRGWVLAQDNTVLLLQWYIDTGTAGIHQLYPYLEGGFAHWYHTMPMCKQLLPGLEVCNII